MPLKRLNDLLAQAVAETDIAAPHEMAEYVNNKLNDLDREEFFVDLLTGYVKRFYAVDRMTKPEQTEADFDPESSVAPQPYVNPAKGQKAYIGKTTALIRNWWQEELRQRITIDGRTVILGECTSADLRILAEERFTLANKIVSKGNRYAKLADTMDAKNASRLSDLDESDIS